MNVNIKSAKDQCYDGASRTKQGVATQIKGLNWKTL